MKSNQHLHGQSITLAQDAQQHVFGAYVVVTESEGFA